MLFKDNCINQPLVIGNRNVRTMEIVALPKLHFLMGVVQHAFNALKKESEETADEWLKKSGVFLDHFQQFNGNNARKLLKSVV